MSNARTPGGMSFNEMFWQLPEHSLCTSREALSSLHSNRARFISGLTFLGFCSSMYAGRTWHIFSTLQNNNVAKIHTCVVNVKESALHQIWILSGWDIWNYIKCGLYKVNILHMFMIFLTIIFMAFFERLPVFSFIY